MTITERAALEGLRLRCIDELAKGNRRMATEEERLAITHRATKEASQMSTVDSMVFYLGYMPLFKCLATWLDLNRVLPMVVQEPDLIAGIAIDILNKEEEGEGAT